MQTYAVRIHPYRKLVHVTFNVDIDDIDERELRAARIDSGQSKRES